jgi:hypothetical protein
MRHRPEQALRLRRLEVLDARLMRAGTTSTCPSASGCTSRKATTSLLRATISAGISPATMRQKMQVMGFP